MREGLYGGLGMWRRPLTLAPGVWLRRGAAPGTSLGLTHGERLRRVQAQGWTFVQAQHDGEVSRGGLLAAHAANRVPRAPCPYGLAGPDRDRRDLPAGRGGRKVRRLDLRPHRLSDPPVAIPNAPSVGEGLDERRLSGESPLELWAVVSEGVLLQQVGGPRVMAEQLQYLVAASESPNVNVQVLPFSRGAHASMFGPYVVLGFPEQGALDVVLADNPTGSMWLEREAEVARYHDLFDAARTSALSPVESRAAIHRRAKEHRA